MLQSAHLGIEVAQAGRDARQAAVALVGVCRHVDGGGQRIGKALEAAVITAGLGDFVEAFFRLLDLLRGEEFDRRVERLVHQILADADQVPAQRQIVDRASVILRIDDGGRFGCKAGEILRYRHAADVGLGRNERLQRHRRRDLVQPDQAAGDLVEVLVDRLEEMPRLKKVRHAIERVVVDEDRAKQALLGLDIMRGRTIGGRAGGGRQLESGPNQLRAMRRKLFFGIGRYWDAGLGRR